MWEPISADHGFKGTAYELICFGRVGPAVLLLLTSGQTSGPS